MAASINAQSKLKFALLTILLTVAMLVSLGVTELSRASSDNLTEAVEGELGTAGTYRIEPVSGLGLSRADLFATLRDVSRHFSTKPFRAAELFSAVKPECPPYNQIPQLAAAVLWDDHNRPVPFTAGEWTRTSADLCLGGLMVPRTSVREATPIEERMFSASLVIDPIYETQLRLAHGRSPSYTIVIITDTTEDRSNELKTALNSAFADATAKAGIPNGQAVVVTRGDSGESIRAATAGVQLVYGLIGWGVLLVGGIGVLVAELIVLRDRTWFFGLARASGARRWSIAWLVIADIITVVLAAVTLAGIVLATTAPLVHSFGRTAFQTDLQLLRTAALPSLTLGLMFVLVIGGAYPAWRATRLDPLDVLERR